jgi:murein L,D-transpeptidase YafK
MLRFFIFISLSLLWACESGGNLLVSNEPKKTLKKIVTERKIPASELKIIIEKEARTFSVYYKSECLITYPCVLGFAPEGDKMQEGDGKTPEGTFGIKSMYKHKSWSYFIWIDYPNETSWKRFNERKKNGLLDKNATIGGEIGIHGVPQGSDDLIENVSDWTLGCISLSTKNITDVYQSINTKTKIEIVK